MSVKLFIILFAFFVQFTDKKGSEHIALSEDALEKREKRNIAIDSMDYAVSPTYVDSLKQIGCHIYHTSRWLNGATIETNDSIIDIIKKWPFVDTVHLTRTSNSAFGIHSVSLLKTIVELENKEKGYEMNMQIRGQLDQINLPKLHKEGYRGQGITMAIIDGGFQNADSHSAFDSIREQILGMYDMTDDTDDICGQTGDHGTKCFGTIAAKTADYMGAATAANYYLIHSEEHFTESPKEMDNWVAAIELADSLGVDILSSSLGYAMFDNQQFTLSYSDMDGKSTRCTQAAKIASRKGMLVVVAAGNEGNKMWHYICAPSDADSILTVGAVDIHDSIAAFSSWGPSADGRVKPEVCALGHQTELINPVGINVIRGNGTSFACPIIAGMAACLWSALPDASNIEIRERIIQSANQYDLPNNQYGYGIPDAWKAYNIETSVVDVVEEKIVQVRKIMIDGVLWIMYNGSMYNVLGEKQ